MNIASLGPGYSAPSTASGNALPQTEKTGPSGLPESGGRGSAPTDLRNVSIDEINTLIKSGKTELLDVVPFIPPNTLEQYNYDPESIGSHRVDLLGQVEKSMEFKASRGEDTSALEKALENLKQIDGSYLPAKIDIIA